jgi:hypothetical protein
MDLPLEIVVPVIIGLVTLFATLKAGQAFTGNGRRKRSHDWQPRRSYEWERPAPPSRAPDAADQLRTVENNEYRAQNLLRHQEAKVFAAAESAVREAGADWRVFAQVSLGEVLICENREGFNAINAKRVDLLITDAGFAPIAAIEYQGSGHHLGKAAARDAVKKEALRRAGIAYIEITGNHGPEDVRREIGRLVYSRTRSPAETMRRVTGA